MIRAWEKAVVYGFNMLYRGADKSLAQRGMKQATATEVFDVHISYL